MIVIKIKGGLGNQMFQYAVAKAYALEKNRPFLLDTSIFESYKLHNYGLHHFAMQPTFFKPFTKWQLKLKKLVGKVVYFNEDNYAFNFNANLFGLPSNLLFLEGYFQTERYFLKYENEIRADFEIISPLKQQTKDTIAYMQTVNAVSIHFRRGDYIGNAVHETDKTEYYQEAMKIIESKIENPVYFLFSDDMPWVKENFTTNFETHYIDFNDAATNFEDIKLMSSCKHNIMANSSFSWWGAWLNPNKNKTVIAPKLWFNNETVNTSDVIPENWIKL
jgi:hypothetical protein